MTASIIICIETLYLLFQEKSSKTMQAICFLRSKTTQKTYENRRGEKMRSDNRQKSIKI